MRERKEEEGNQQKGYSPDLCVSELLLLLESQMVFWSMRMCCICLCVLSRPVIIIWTNETNTFSDCNQTAALFFARASVAHVCEWLVESLTQPTYIPHIHYTLNTHTQKEDTIEHHTTSFAHSQANNLCAKPFIRSWYLSYQLSLWSVFFFHLFYSQLVGSNNCLPKISVYS